MLVLALDTTTRAGSVAVTRDAAVLAVVAGDATRTHGERMPDEIAKALEIARIKAEDLNLLVVASGPGAFTGLRIGLAAMQGLAMVLRTPVVGVSALEALAETAWTELGVDPMWMVAPWMDAARGEVFGALYARNADAVLETTPAVAGTPAVLLASMTSRTETPVAFVGDGAVKYASLIRESSSRERRVIEVIDRLPPLAPALSRLGRRLAANGGAGPPHALQPLYVRRPDVELERERDRRADS